MSEIDNVVSKPILIVFSLSTILAILGIFYSMLLWIQIAYIIAVNVLYLCFYRHDLKHQYNPKVTIGCWIFIDVVILLGSLNVFILH